MIKTIVAHTTEVDDIELAVSEITKQIDSGEIKAHTVGFVFCHYEFIYSGVLKAVCNAFPFDTVGTMTTAQAINGISETFMLTLVVLTSDDALFSAKLTSPITGEFHEIIENDYKAAEIKEIGRAHV